MSRPSWGLLIGPHYWDLIHNLYVAHKDNQLFLHARFGLEKDVLEPYKRLLDRWLWPDVFRNQDTSVSKQSKRSATTKRQWATVKAWPN
jgi:hypothetical protein